MMVRSLVKRCVVASRGFNRVFSGAASNTFYDSQSGGFITRPGSQGTRIHDTKLKCMIMTASVNSAAASKIIVDYLRGASGLQGVRSVSIPIIASDELFKQYMNSSVPYLIRNQSHIKVKVASQPQNLVQLNLLRDVITANVQAKDVLETEIDIIVSKDTNLKDANGNEVVSSLPQLSTQGLVTRANVHISIDPFINKDESELLSVIEMGEVFARLCDVGVKVINITLCSSSPITDTLEPAVVDNILDYLREILEEGLNLDVSGDALLERLSVQCTNDNILPGVVELAQGLGITRFTIAGVGMNDSIVAKEADGLVDNKGKIMMRGDKGVLIPFYVLPSTGATTFAEKYLI